MATHKPSESLLSDDDEDTISICNDFGSDVRTVDTTFRPVHSTSVFVPINKYKKYL
jgi:hypothetical protein